MVEGLAAALRGRGHEVATQVGQSRFRCDLALRRPGESEHTVGVFVDSAVHYGNPDLLERYVTQPAIMAAFGWSVALVLARDWYFEPDAVLDRLERLLRSEPPTDEAAPATEQETAAAPPTVGEGSADAPSLVRRLEFTEGNSRKFWQVTCRGSEVVTEFGRIGSKGQTHSKQFPDTGSAAREAHRLTAEKLRKGYQETTESRP